MPVIAKWIGVSRHNRAIGRDVDKSSFPILLVDGESPPEFDERPRHPGETIDQFERSPSPNGNDSWEKAQANKSAYIRYANRRHGRGMPGSPLLADSNASRKVRNSGQWNKIANRIPSIPLDWLPDPHAPVLSDEEFERREEED